MHDVAEVVIKKLTTREKYTPSPDWNYAHVAGSSCARELAYWRLHPDQAMAHDAELFLIFAHGHWVAKEALSQLDKAGYEVSEQEASFEDRQLRLRGRIDCKIRLDSHKRPVEIKGYHPATWNRLNTIQDFMDSDHEYLRRVPGQLLSYMLMGGRQGDETGIFYLVNKLTGKPKTILLHLEGATLVWGEAMLKRLETVNKAVEKKTLPERIPYEHNVCGSCPFRVPCLSEMPSNVKDPVVLDPEKQAELMALLKTWEETKGAAKKYKDADEDIGEIVKATSADQIVLGDYIIKLSRFDQERVDSKKMPPDIKKLYLKTISTVRKTITNSKVPEKQQPQE